MSRANTAATVGVGAIGLVLTVVVGGLLVAQARAEHSTRLHRAADVLHTSLAREMESLQASAEGLRNGLTIDDTEPLAWPVDRRQVDQAIQRGFSERVLGAARAISLFRVVPPDELEDYEQFMAANIDGFHVHPRPQDLAYVVEELHPLQGNEAAVGFDLGSETRRRAAVERARDTGSPSTTEPLSLIQDDGQRTVILFVPSYASFDVPDTAPARREAFVGGISLVLDVEALLHRAVAQTPPVEVSIIDVGRIGLAGTAQATEDGTLLMGSAPRAGSAQTDLHVGDRRWRLIVTATEEFGGPNMLPVALWTLAMLLLIAMAVTLVRVLGGREGRATALADARTEQLRDSEARLRELNARLTESDALKTSFLVTVSHELRTPLTTIRGFADLLQRPAADLSEDDKAIFLSQLSRSAEALSDLLSEVLEFAELEQLGPLVSTKAFALRAVVQDVSAAYRDSNPIALTAATDLHVVGDPQHLRRALHAVLANARAYSPPGSTIGIWLRPAATHAEIVIDDEGPGISAAERQLAFQRFYRGAQAASSNIPGTGIGLTVAQRLLEAMGGSIALDDAPGGGTRVILSVLSAQGGGVDADQAIEATT